MRRLLENSACPVSLTIDEGSSAWMFRVDTPTIALSGFLQTLELRTGWHGGSPHKSLLAIKTFGVFHSGETMNARFHDTCER